MEPSKIVSEYPREELVPSRTLRDLLNQIYNSNDMWLTLLRLGMPVRHELFSRGIRTRHTRRTTHITQDTSVYGLG